MLDGGIEDEEEDEEEEDRQCEAKVIATASTALRSSVTYRDAN
jgi:hypothetical protein